MQNEKSLLQCIMMYIRVIYEFFCLQQTVLSQILENCNCTHRLVSNFTLLNLCLRQCKGVVLNDGIISYFIISYFHNNFIIISVSTFQNKRIGSSQLCSKILNKFYVGGLRIVFFFLIFGSFWVFHHLTIAFLNMHMWSKRAWDSRGQLCVVDQVFQWVTAAELVQQPGQVADDGRWIWRVDIPWYVPNLHQRQVPISIRPLSGRDLRGERHRCG